MIYNRRLATDYNRVDIDWSDLVAMRMGTSGADTLRGYSGKDQFYGYGSNDTFIGNGGVDAFNGGEGTDTVDYSTIAEQPRYTDFGLDINGVGVNLASGIGGEMFEGNDTYTSIENVTGSNFNDFLIGDANVNVLRGMDGNDMIEGGAGGDTLDGGAGSDTLSYSGSNARVIVNLQTGSASGGHATGDVISLFENLIGSQHNDILTGNGGDNVIHGGAGGDTMDGAGGLNDTVSYRFSNAGVTVNLLNNTASGGHATGDTIVRFENIEGSNFGDTLTGSGLGNVIEGHGGIDVIDGGLGDDTLEGGADNDTMTGGGNRDTFKFLASEDTGHDHITDFNVFEDKLVFDADGATNVTISYEALTLTRGNFIVDFGNGSTVTLDNLAITDALFLGVEIV